MNEVLEPEIVETNGGGMSAPERLLTSGRAVQKMQSTYATAVAVQRPREIKRVERSLLQEAIMAGEDFYYGWTVKDNKGKASRIEGPSVDLALAAARCFGNCAVESLPVQDGGDSWIFTGAFVDLETGFTITRQFRQSKQSVIYGKMDNERKDDIRFQIGQSKAIRNVVLNALPPSLIRHAMEEAKKGVREKIEAFIKSNGLPAAIDALVKALGKLGVKELAILDRVGVADAKAMTVDHLVMLRGDLTAIQNGQEYADTLFPAAAPQKEGTSLKDKIKSGGEKKDDSPPADHQNDGQPAEDAPPPPIDNGAGEPPLVMVDGATVTTLQGLLSQLKIASVPWRKQRNIAKWEDMLQQEALAAIAELKKQLPAAREPGSDDQ